MEGRKQGRREATNEERKEGRKDRIKRCSDLNGKSSIFPNAKQNVFQEGEDKISSRWLLLRTILKSDARS